VLDALQLSKAHLFGASWGGFIARALAERAPDRIDRLVLLVPAGIIRAPAFRAMTKAAIPMLLYRTMGSRAALDRFLDSMLTGPDDRLEAYLGAAIQHYKLDVAVPPLGTPEALAGFRRPTLVIAASDDITAPGAALLERARELFPHAILELLPNCKHIPPTDDVSRAKLCGRVASFLLGEGETSPSVAE
jgi:pimeloyl-ACP methyl ester carboxylesterase